MLAKENHFFETQHNNYGGEKGKKEYYWFLGYCISYFIMNLATIELFKIAQNKQLFIEVKREGLNPPCYK